MRAIPSFSKRDMVPHSRLSLGSLVAELLSGAWRSSPPAPSNSLEELEEIAKLLLVSGAASLAWYKIRHSDLGSSPVADGFHQAYRMDTLHAALHQRTLKQVIPLLRASAVEPLLVKGWAIARHYPEPGIRPYTDIDLCVMQDQYARAEAALRSPEVRGCDVDLHLGFDKFDDHKGDEILARSQLVKLDDVEVRVLSAEDHLRFVCMHLLRHGVTRPLWLCDVAVLLETRPKNFNWDHCLSDSRRQADWVACAIGLAHRLLGADVEGTPIAHRAKSLPRWLAPAVLREWGVSYYFPGQVAVYLRNLGLWRGLLKELPRHWPNPIEATATLGGAFNELPRLPFQVGHVISRTASLLSQIRRPLGGGVQRSN